MSTPLLMFLVFIAITLGITWWAAGRSSGASAYFAAGRRITGWQNGIAVAGDYMSAASFLGIAGIIAFQGFDGFMYSVGWLVPATPRSEKHSRSCTGTLRIRGPLLPWQKKRESHVRCSLSGFVITSRSLQWHTTASQ